MLGKCVDGAEKCMDRLYRSKPAGPHVLARAAAVDEGARVHSASVQGV